MSRWQAEDWRRQHGKEMATGGKYNPFGDNQNILGKYDEDAGRATLTLDASGSVDEAKAKKLAAIKAKLQAAAGVGATASYDLSTPAKAVEFSSKGEDYQTAEEAAAFKKTSGKGKKMRRKEKTSLDIDALAKGASTGADHASQKQREARARVREQESEEAQEHKRQRFDRAVAMAEGKAVEMMSSAAGEGMEVEEGVGREEETEVDPELYAALARARRLSSMKAEMRSEDYAAQRVAAQLEAAGQWREEQGGEGVELSSLEFSETGEFCKAVRAKDDMGESADLPSAVYKQAKATTSTSEGKVKVEADVVKEEEGEGGEEEAEGSSGIKKDLDLLHERPAASGLSAVLEIVRNRGLLGTEKEASGRMFDQKGAGLHNYQDGEEDTSFQLNVT